MSSASYPRVLPREVDGARRWESGEGTQVIAIEARPAVHELAKRGILGGVSLGRLYPGEDTLANGLVVAVTETVTDEDVDAFAKALQGVLA